uniref:XK-related protein n=1 Tax=Astyanax mexicanus TaxID=7994 RepID=W5LDI8_ASTMX
MGSQLNLPVWSSLLALGSVVLFFVGLALDVDTVISLFHERNYVYMGVSIALLLISSIILQVISFIWYSEPDKNLETTVETFVNNNGFIGMLHILQLGILLRLAGVAEINIRNIRQKERFQKGEVVFQNHEISMLNLFKKCMGSAPQVILKIVRTVQEQDPEPFTVFKIAASLAFISFSVLFNQDVCRITLKERKKKIPSAVFFLWNLFVIPLRVVAVALFASVLPFYNLVHFFFVWFLLFLWAWRQKTDLMEDKRGEVLYRIILGVIWYFNCFCGTNGVTKVKRNIYDVFMLLDTMLLLGLWFWRRSVESARLNPLIVNPLVLLGVLAALYFTGFLLKQLYYWKFHPKCPCFRFEVEDQTPQAPLQRSPATMVDSVEPESVTPETITELQRVTSAEKRMRKMALNFYG